jgi:hypothetical protein
MRLRETPGQGKIELAGSLLFYRAADLDLLQLYLKLGLAHQRRFQTLQQSKLLSRTGQAANLLCGPSLSDSHAAHHEYQQDQARRALKRTYNIVERSQDYLHDSGADTPEGF